MKLNIHAGHNPAGKIACGAVGFLNESTEARIIKNEVIRQLQLMDHEVYDCTCDDGKSVADVLNKIVSKCNAHDVDLDISIHLNAGKGTGCEVLVYDKKSKNAIAAAEKIAAHISVALGIKDRGIKCRPDLYVLRNTKAQALLIEVCFVDNSIDATCYSAQAAANAIVKALTGSIYKEPEATDVTNDPHIDTDMAADPSEIYYVQVGAFKNKDNAEKLALDLKAKGFNPIVKRG